MRCLQNIGRGMKFVGCATAGWLALYGTAFAQPNKTPPSNDGGSYVFSYALILLGVALGMMAVCRPSNRRDRAKADQIEEKLAEKE